MRFDEILQRLADLDQAAEPIPEEMWEEIRELAADKVDAIKTVLDRLAMEASRLTKTATEFRDAARAVENNHDRLKEHVAWVMEQADCEKMPGEKWALSLRQSPPSVEVDREASSAEMAIYPQYVVETTTYKWDKDALKKAMQAVVAPARFAFARLKRGRYAQFTVRKST